MSINVPTSTLGMVGSETFAAGAARDRIERLRAHGFREIPADDLTVRQVGGQRFLVDGSGVVWVQRPGIPRTGYDAGRHAFVIEGGEIRMLCRASDHDGPRDVRDVEDLEREHDAAMARSHAAAAAQREAARAAAQPVTLGHVDPDVPPRVDTLRRAVEWTDARGGRVEIEGGRLVVRMPPSLLRPIANRCPGAAVARLLYAAEAALVSVARGKDGQIAPEKVPDGAVLPTGVVLR